MPWVLWIVPRNVIFVKFSPSKNILQLELNFPSFIVNLIVYLQFFDLLRSFGLSNLIPNHYSEFCWVGKGFGCTRSIGSQQRANTWEYQSKRPSGTQTTRSLSSGVKSSINNIWIWIIYFLTVIFPQFSILFLWPMSFCIRNVLKLNLPSRFLIFYYWLINYIVFFL